MEEAKQKSKFVTEGRFYQFKAMPFGLCGAPATFEQLMEKVFVGLQWQSCLVYLDNVTVYSKEVATHLVQLNGVFQLLRLLQREIQPTVQTHRWEILIPEK